MKTRCVGIRHVACDAGDQRPLLCSSTKDQIGEKPEAETGDQVELEHQRRYLTVIANGDLLARFTPLARQPMLQPL